MSLRIVPATTGHSHSASCRPSSCVTHRFVDPVSSAARMKREKRIRRIKADSGVHFQRSARQRLQSFVSWASFERRERTTEQTKETEWDGRPATASGGERTTVSVPIREIRGRNLWSMGNHGWAPMGTDRQLGGRCLAAGPPCRQGTEAFVGLARFAVANREPRIARIRRMKRLVRTGNSPTLRGFRLFRGSSLLVSGFGCGSAALG